MRDVLSFVVFRLLAAAAGLIILLFVLYNSVYLLPPGPFSEGTVELAERVTFTGWLFGSGDDRGVLNNDFGNSFAQNRPAAEMVTERFPATSELLYSALFLSLLVGVPLGLLMAYLTRRLVDFLRPLAWLGKSLPIFWLGMMLIFIVAFQQRALPVSGRCSISISDDACGEQIQHLILPLMTLVIVWGSAVMLLVRRFALAVFTENNTRGQAVARLIGFILLSLPALVAGILSSLVIIESIFAWPGIGRLVVESGVRADYPLLAAVVIPISVNLTVFYAFCLLVYAILCSALRLNPNDPVISSIAFPEFSWLPSGEKLKAKRDPRLSDRIGTIAAIIAFIILAVIFVTSNVPSIVNSADPMQANPADRLLPMNSEGHPLGTDDLGRDSQAQLLAAGQTTLNTALTAALIALFIGLINGVIGGIASGIPGRFLSLPMQVGVDALTVGPILFILVALALVFRPQASGLAVLVALVAWTANAPIIRAGMRAALAGANFGLMGWLRLLAYALLVTFSTAILLETSLSFLGLGIQPPTPSWGVILARAMALLNNAAHIAVLPGLLITLTLLCLNIIIGRLYDSLPALDAGE